MGPRTNKTFLHYTINIGHGNLIMEYLKHDDNILGHFLVW